MKKVILAIASLGFHFIHAQDLIITGIIDGPLTGGTPKAIELYATANIADLSLYGVGSANNGEGSDDAELILSGSAVNGAFIYVATESTEFNNFFGFSPDFTGGAANINGDDAIELFYDVTGLFSGAESVIDVFGDINVDGTGEAWEYLDGWAYRNNVSGPDGSTFTLANWSFSGTNALDMESTNGTASTPFPVGTYTPIAGDFTAPVWSTSFPHLDNLTATSFDLFGQIDEPGTIYFVGIANDDTAPSSAQVVAGSAPGGVLFSGSIVVPSALSPVSTNVSGLVEGLNYDVYIVAQDDEGVPNLQSSPIKLNFPPEFVAITEFLNNSLGNDGADPAIGNETTNEWIELFNYGTNAVDLTGWSISDEGSDNDIIGAITINPGDFVILAKSKTYFEAQWLSGVPNARVIELAITLADGEDEIILSDPDGNLIWSLSYVDDETAGDATYLGTSENSSSTSFVIVRDGNDNTGTLGYEDTGDGLTTTSTIGDTGSPLQGAYAQPLPVELISFSGVDGMGVAALEWKTMTEINNSGFEVQKSLDGESFEKIGFVSGNGNSSQIIDYQFTDYSFYQPAYYRLRQIDYNGASELSKTIFLISEEHSLMSIYPNPVRGYVRIETFLEAFELVIVDLSGRKVFAERVSKSEAETAILQLEKGIYSVSFSDQHSSQSFKFVKK